MKALKAIRPGAGKPYAFNTFGGSGSAQARGPQAAWFGCFYQEKSKKKDIL
jgi:hypothetical protein